MFIATIMQSTERRRSGMQADVAMTTTAFRTARAMPPRWGLIGV